MGAINILLVKNTKKYATSYVEIALIKNYTRTTEQVTAHRIHDA